MEQTMDCDVCMQTFNDAERRPKFLPCGHTYCLSCLMQLPAKQCPVDQKVFQLDNLIDNYKLLNAPLKPPRFWCIPCEKAATEECLDSHTVHSLKLQRTKASGPLLEALRQGEAGLLGLAGVLDKAAVARQADDCGDWLERQHVDLVAARNRLEDALEADTAA
ncbi:E3 ubiquitin-protein ligase RNF166-like isoform X1 [Thrips palmi]|uniref:E3 ubiquitin-protein ligase RNF166-like isoform X1 n=2 Tax=Thrips palmi TaxID=161013 RepID=A0A6P8YNZ0_THRPL|nr:E3 ubiquitin-protein ligase RNF166-like isoform X1 [Thrips palmi]